MDCTAARRDHPPLRTMYLLQLFGLCVLFHDALSSVLHTSSPPTIFHVSSGDNDNYFYRDNVTTAQLLLTNSLPTPNSPRRFVAALPAGNNGALVYFLPKNATQSLDVQLVNGTITSAAVSQSRGVQADLQFSADATLGVTIIGAVRAMRDYVEGSGTMHEIFNYTLAAFSSTEVHLHRKYINSTFNDPGVFMSVDLYLSVPPGSLARFSVKTNENINVVPPTIDILLPPPNAHRTTDRSRIRVAVVTSEATLPGFSPDALFLSQQDASTASISSAIGALSSNITEEVSFLAFQEKFTAGGWRFLTYFGRDTMIALRMLMPIMTSDAVETILGAVIERANSTGALCHEETIGDYASFVNIGNGNPDLGNTPFYDYKMIDTDLLLVPALAHYFLELPQGTNGSSQFFSKQATLQNGTYLNITNRIVSYNVNRAMPFFLADPPTASDLLSFRPGQPVGNWRDSNQGTGYGPIPFDVNVALVPANLRAVGLLSAAGVLNLDDLGLGGVDVVAMAEKWEAQAPLMFEVSVDADTAEARLQDFVEQVSLNEELLGNSTTPAANVSFYALSLMADGSPVEVLNSDLSFKLIYGTNLTDTFLQRVVDAMSPYPRGLLTNIGMVVANPAYDSNRTNIQVLDRTAYHGTVVWSFQQALMAGGIAKQLALCPGLNTTTVDINPAPSTPPTWCSDDSLVNDLQDAQSRLWTSIRGASSNIYSEVWSYSFDNNTGLFEIADLAALSPDGTESDAIQLWSYGFLGLIAPPS